MPAKYSKETITRPNIGWRDGLKRLFLILILGVIALCLLFKILLHEYISWWVLNELCIMVVALTTMRGNVLLAIRLYQRYAPEHVRQRCAMTPTCSEYAVMAICRYGILKGSWMTYCRLCFRCDGTPITNYP